MSLTSPGFARAALVLAAKDLRVEWRTLHSVSASAVFALIVLVIFHLAFASGGERTGAAATAEVLAPGVIWIVLAFACVVGLAPTFEVERRQETLHALWLAPVDRTAWFIGKLVANGVKILLVQLALIPVIAVFFQFDWLELALPLGAIVLLHGIGLTELGTLFAAVATRVGRGEALLATLLLPAAAPLLISAMECTSVVLDARPLAEVTRWLLLASGFDLLYLFLALATFELILED